MSSKGSNALLAVKAFYYRLFLRSVEGEGSIVDVSLRTWFPPDTNLYPATNLRLKLAYMPETTLLPSASILLY